MADTADGRAVHQAVARAAGLRNRAGRRHRAWRAAPFFAVLFLLAAVAGRLAVWPAALTLACGAILALLLAAYALLPRRTDVVSDAEAAALDDRAALGGELRSAHWFSSQPSGSAWISYHLSRARDRIGATPWADLYAPQRRPRAYAITAIFAATGVFIALSGPTTRAALAPGVQTGPAAPQPGRALTAAEIERQLAALLASLEARDAAGARPITAEEIRKLAERVLESQKQNAGRPGATIDEELQKRLERASQMDSLDPEVREALDDLKKTLAASRDQTAKAGDPAADQNAKAGPQDGQATQNSKPGGQQEQMSGQVLSDSQPGAGFGVVGMTNERGAPPQQPGLGMGGGESGSPNSGVMVELGAALRRETLESGAGEAVGDPATDLRHKTDRGTASVAFSRGSGAAAARGRTRSAAVIPEARRPAARTYFQRKR